MGLFDKSKRKRVAAQTTGPLPSVLIVDDEEFNLTSLRALIEDDYEVLTAPNAMEGLRLLNERQAYAPVDVIISDQRMPGITGVDFLQQAIAVNSEAKRILITGFTDVEVIVDAINKAQIFKYIKKPLDSQELKLLLARAIETRRLEQQNRQLIGELQQALERLRLLDQDKLSFLRYLSHEMNTPLNWISAAQTIDINDLTDDDKQMLACVESGQLRLRKLISAVLRYFELTASNQAPRCHQVDLALLLREELDSQNCAGEPGRVAQKIDIPVTQTISSDVTLVRELVRHLLENAFTHAGTDSRPPVVETSLAQKNGQTLLTIKENGQGIKNREAEEVFTPFHAWGSQHGAGGFGISLATARVLAHRLGGNIAIANTPEGGTLTSLTLPVEQTIAKTAAS